MHKQIREDRQQKSGVAGKRVKCCNMKTEWERELKTLFDHQRL